jgi:dTMP kinase
VAGFFITFEGIHGAGKSTVLRATAKSLEAIGFPSITVIDQQGTVIGKRLRRINLDIVKDPIVEALLIAAIRRENVIEVIRPNVTNGKIVLAERFNDALFSFQGAGRGLKMTFLKELAINIQEDLVPDLTILLDLEPKIALARLKVKHRIENEHLEFHEKVREGYLAIARGNPQRIKVINANLGKREVFNEVWLTVTKFLESRELKT